LVEAAEGTAEGAASLYCSRLDEEEEDDCSLLDEEDDSM